MKKFIFLLILFIKSEGFSKSVYLAESLSINNSINFKEPYCTLFANPLRDFQATYEGIEGSDYQCNIEFSIKRLNSGGNESGFRTIAYSGRPQIITSARHHKDSLGIRLEEKFGYFGVFSIIDGGMGMGSGLDSLYFAPLNGIVHGFYESLNLFSEMYENHQKKKQLKLTPSFEATMIAGQEACRMILEELSLTACDENSEAQIDRAMNYFNSPEGSFERLIPKNHKNYQRLIPKK